MDSVKHFEMVKRVKKVSFNFKHYYLHFLKVKFVSQQPCAKLMNFQLYTPKEYLCLSVFFLLVKNFTFENNFNFFWFGINLRESLYFKIQYRQICCNLQWKCLLSGKLYINSYNLGLHLNDLWFIKIKRK
jgi:hypothetical protein